jgi:uridine kinase
LHTNKPFIVSITAVSGGGKTTITNRLNELLPNCKALFFDDYDFKCPDDICDWVERGSDFNEWNLTPLVNDLISLITNQLEPIEFILLDYPFSKSHKAVRDYIDYTILIDTPLDIAMARRILRDFKHSSIDEVFNDLGNYLSRGRFAYLNAQITDRNNCELIIDGSLPLTSVVDELYETIIRVSKHTRLCQELRLTPYSRVVANAPRSARGISEKPIQADNLCDPKIGI